MTICDAIQGTRKLSFSYDGRNRIVEPHTYGTDGKGHKALRAYQTSGGSESGEYVGWEIFHADKIGNLSILSDTFSCSRPGYKRGDSAFQTIGCQL